MRPLQLSIKGFGAFREPTHIDFTDIDLVALVGPTGSGKSTIIDAITFALYGTVARYEDNRLVAPAINQTSTEARVALDFELNQQVYTAVRVVRRTTGGGATTREARLEQAERVLAGDAALMSKEVEERLGLKVGQFNRTVVLPQGKFAAFLHDKPGDRQTTLVRLLGLQLYRRIGQEARSRKEKAGNHADALRSEHAKAAGELTDEQRAGLEGRIAALAAASERWRRDRAEIMALESETGDLKDRIGWLDERIDRMREMAVPADLDDLADQITTAEQAQCKAEALRSEWSAIRRRADHALKSGPDPVAVQLELNIHTELAERARDHQTIARKLSEAIAKYQSASGEADRVRETQEELKRCVEENRKIEADARAARDAQVTVAQIEGWERLHNRHQAAVEKASVADQAVRSVEEALPSRRAACQETASTAAATSARVAELQLRAGVLGHLDLLEVGQDCPLCLQEVSRLPTHDFQDADLRRAKEQKDLAHAAAAAAQEAYNQAVVELKGRQAAASSARLAAQNCQSDVASLPPAEQLNALLAEAQQLAEAAVLAENATQKAEAAARRHLSSPAYAEVLGAENQAFEQQTLLIAEERTLEKQLASLRVKVDAIPGEEELRARLAEANRLRAELDEADSQLQNAEARHKHAADQLGKMNKRRQQATALLNAARDRVAPFGPPPIDPSDLVAAWKTLTDWADEQTRAARVERRSAMERRSEQEKRRAGLVESLRALCHEVVGPTDPLADPEELGRLLTDNLAATETELTHFDQRMVELKDLEKRIEARDEQARVAHHLGRLLRTDGFERWLMETALHRLVEQATKQLFELSNGQYSLELHGGDFFVRDHTNADELRRARTLSGGETFLASLSLALALADATAEMSTGVVPAMESIFLDEGFGTLDRHTLETVATAVEELGVGGRLVGIVTHIRELADRMPVRLELTKTGGSATVERIDI